MTKCGFDKKDCIKEKCEFYTHLIGKDPQSTAQIDKFGCAIAFVPMLLVEVAQMSRGTSAAIEDFRNETVNINGVATAILGNALEHQKKITGAQGEITN